MTARSCRSARPQELFEKPKHTFVGYFIGSPGYERAPCQLADGGVKVGGAHIAFPSTQGSSLRAGARLAFGVRPEYVTMTDVAEAVRSPPSSWT